MINLEQYIDLTTLMVLATQDENGNPYTSNVYFGHDPETYKFYFISRLTREHSQHILNHENVAWSVVNSEQTASSGSNKRGLQFQGTAFKLASEEAIKMFNTYYQPKIQFEGGFPEGHEVFECIPAQVRIWDEALFGGNGKIIKL